MNEEWWENPVCIACDYWWVLLIALVLGVSAYFSRGYWLPEPVDLCFNGHADVPIREAIPPRWGDTDILFAFDQSGSMGFMIDGAKADAKELMNTIGARLGAERFGVAGFSDYVDFPYRLYQPVTGDYDAVQTAIDGLTLADGGDLPEAYGRLMYESYSDPAIAWGADTQRYLVILGDSVPHDPDAGRDGVLGSADDLILSDVLQQLKANKIVVIYVADPSIFDDSSLLMQWQTWTQATDGIAIHCASS